MDAALFREPRRRMIAIDSRAGPGDMAALEFGPQDRPVDVVFLHANGFNAQTYRAILAPLAAGLRILAIDQRGHGASRLAARPEGRRSWLDLRDDLVALLAVLDPDAPVVLAGHSMGATVSLLAAADRPERVRALALFEPVILPWALALYARAPWAAAILRRRMPLAKAALRRRAEFDSREAAFAAYRGRGAFRSWPETLLADYVGGGFVDTPDGKVRLACAPEWEASNYAAQGHDPWRALGRVACSTRILKAERGSTCGTGDPRGLARRYPNLRVDVVAGTSHFLPMERADLIRETIFDLAAWIRTSC